MNTENMRGMTINQMNKCFQWGSEWGTEEPRRAPCGWFSLLWSIRPTQQTLASAHATPRWSSWTAAGKSHFKLITIHDGGGGAFSNDKSKAAAVIAYQHRNWRRCDARWKREKVEDNDWSRKKGVSKSLLRELCTARAALSPLKHVHRWDTI